MATQDDLSSSISRFAREIERRETDKTMMESRESERRQEFLDEWRAACDQVVIPVFKRVEKELAGNELVEVGWSDDQTTVSFWVKAKHKRSHLRYSVHPTEQRVTMAGLPVERGLSRDLDFGPQDIGLDGLSEPKVTAAVKAFLGWFSANY